LEFGVELILTIKKWVLNFVDEKNIPKGEISIKLKFN